MAFSAVTDTTNENRKQLSLFLDVLAISSDIKEAWLAIIPIWPCLDIGFQGLWDVITDPPLLLALGSCSLGKLGLQGR